ncbi:hsp70 nucleotide exchange factor FES1 [Papaver somniferum]|uniref:hsp70 nucleotide exchange factor FES1 n=1 Tax=Papaver somniferum TaxID=3469 RepID=UPI000E6FAF6C|nr:hsp70 nucleotide exchange factor FES1 [Papaver somniferum]
MVKLISRITSPSRIILQFIFLLVVFSSCLIAKEIENNTISNSKFENDNNDNDVVDIEGGGGFPSLDGMLHWAIGHSDPAKLKEAAQSVQSLSADELEIRQQELKEWVENSKMPSDTQLMQIAIADLKNSSLSSEDHHRALQELLHLVELIDNANDLGKLGGIAAVVQELDNSDLQIRITSAWILGKAGQNNPFVQKQILQHGALLKLMKMVQSSSVEEGIKAMYAVSSLSRNSLDGLELFFAGHGERLLQDIMSNSSIDIRLRKKSASLVADLAESLIESTSEPEPQYFSSRYFLKSVVSLVASADFDLQEKALMAVKSLIKLRTTKALDFKDFCALESVLERMREQLHQSSADELDGDLAIGMENLCKEVESLFRKKLEEAPSRDEL